MCHEINHIGDSDIRGLKDKTFDFSSGEVMRKSQPSVRRRTGGRDLEILRLEVSQGEGPRIEHSKL
jgi:hypothetical protein